MRATNTLILSLALAFILTFPAGPIYSAFGFSTVGLLQGQIWTLLTSLFIHVGLFHLAGNLFFLYIFGNALEDEIGAKKTLAIFFLGGVMSLLIGIPFYSPNTHIVGSSIAVSTIVGAVLILKPNNYSRIFFFAPLGLVATIYLIFNAFMGYFQQSGEVAYASHAVGFAMGIIFGLVWRRRSRTTQFQHL